jgi:carbon-monoxide dehydrogenase iron sulfur subunit
MNKVILINCEKCVGCRTCEMVCSLSHDKQIDPYRSRIKVIKWENTVHSVPINCRQCEDAPCAQICPAEAITREEEFSRTQIDYDKCIGCRSCVYVCPFGAMAFNSLEKKVFKCDLCDGYPLCVKFCAYGTLDYVDAGELNKGRQIDAAEKIFALSSNFKISLSNSNTQQ